MIKELKRRFVLNMMMVLIAIFLLMTIGFHLYYNIETHKEVNALLYWVTNTGSISSEDIEKFYQGAESDETISSAQSNSANIIAIKYDANRKLLSMESTEQLLADKKAATLKTADEILQGKHVVSRGLSYKLAKKDYGYYLVMMDTSRSFLIFQYSDYLIAGGIFLIVLIILFLVSQLLSHFVTKPAEDSLNKQKQFVSDASHELKTPLAAIMLNAEALRHTNPENQYLENILSEGARMEKLISNLLELARADDASNKLIMERFNLSDAVLQMTLPFESRAYEEQIRLETNIEENLFYHGSSDDIKQVIVILIDNAFKHTKKNGLISITLEHSGSTSRFRIFNTGEGISETDLPHIFERFYSCDYSRSGNSKSYGLGLAIAHAIIEKHGGSISVSSVYGKHAEFTVTLPQKSTWKSS